MSSTKAKAGRSIISEASWAAIKPRFVQLYRNDNKTLKQTMTILERNGFRASVKMYKTQITKWKLEKNNKDRELLHLIRKHRIFRKSGAQKSFRIRGRPVTVQDAEDHFRRKHVISSEDMLLHRCLSPTPSILSIDSSDASSSDQDVMIGGYSSLDCKMVDVPLRPRLSEMPVNLIDPIQGDHLTNTNKYLPRGEAVPPIWAPNRSRSFSLEHGHAWIQHHGIRNTMHANIMMQFSDVRFGIPPGNIQLFGDEEYAISRALQNPGEQYRGENLLYAMSTLQQAMFEQSTDPSLKSFEYATVERLTQSIVLAHVWCSRKQMTNVLSAYESAQKLFEKMVEERSSSLTRMIGSLLLNLLVASGRRLERQNCVYIQFIEFISAFAQQICHDHPLGYLSVITSKDLQSRRDIIVKILQLFADLSTKYENDSGESSRRNHEWHLGLLRSGMCNEAEMMLPYSNTMSDVESQFDLHFQGAKTFQKVYHIDIQLTLCVRKRDYPRILFWSQKMRSLAVRCGHLPWSARLRAARVHEKMGNLGLAMSEATNALEIAFGIGKYCPEIITSQRFIARLRNKIARTMQDGYQWCAVSGYDC